MDELLTDFLAETAENLSALDDAVLTLERVPDDPATIALVFRLVHTVKGTCGFLSPCPGWNAWRTRRRTCWRRYATASGRPPPA